MATHVRDDDGVRALGVAVLLAAVLQVVAPLVTFIGPGTSPGGSGPELLISPAGWAFSIWGLIYALAIAQAVTVLVRGAAVVPRRLQVDQLVLYLGGTAWIVLAGVDSSVATAGALLVMFAAATDGVLTAARTLPPRGGVHLLGRISIGLYAGWVTAAFFLNLSTALVAAGIVSADEAWWQLVVLGAAVLTLLVLTAAVHLPAFAAAGGWALVGIIAGGVDKDAAAVVALAAASLVVLVVATLWLRHGSGDRAPAGELTRRRR